MGKINPVALLADSDFGWSPGERAGETDLGLSNTPQGDFPNSSNATIPLLRMAPLRRIVETTYGPLEPLEGRARKMVDDELARFLIKDRLLRLA